MKIYLKISCLLLRIIKLEAKITIHITEEETIVVITITAVEAVATIKEMEEVTQVVIMEEAESQKSHYQITSPTYSLTLLKKPY